MASPQAVHLRAVGAATGFKVKRPQTWSELLDVASHLVLNHSRVSHVFDRQGDRIQELDVVEPGEVLYVATDGTWRRPPSVPRLGHSGRTVAFHSADENGGADASYTRRRAAAGASTARLQPARVRHELPAVGQLLFPQELLETPHRLTTEAPARLCAAKPPWGLLGDHTQLGSDANFTRLRGAARQQALVQLCERFASRMQQRSKASLGAQPALFPEGASCAVVGSGGALARSRSGRAIDAHDVVIRFNLAPAGGVLSAHVGERTTIRILTDKTYQSFLRGGAAAVVAHNQSGTNRPGSMRAASRGARSKGAGGRVSEPGSTMLLYCMAQGWVGKCMHEQRMDHINPVFPRRLKMQLDEHRGRGRLPSAGILGIAMAMTSCSRVSLFGFGNASDANGTNECGHYWECSRQQGAYYAGKAGYHDWNAQWRLVSAWIDRVAKNYSSLNSSLLVFHDPRAPPINR